MSPSIIGFLKDNGNLFIDALGDGERDYRLFDDNVLGESGLVNKSLTHILLCHKKDTEAIIAALSLDSQTVVVSAGKDYDGTLLTTSLADGWKLKGIRPRNHSPSFQRLELRYERINASRVELDLPTDLSIASSGGVTTWIWKGTTFLTWDSEAGATTDGLRVTGGLSYGERRYYRVDASDNQRTGVAFRATLNFTVDGKQFMAFSVGQSAYGPQKLLETIKVHVDAGVSGPRFQTFTIMPREKYTTINRSLRWAVNGTNIKLIFWDKEVLNWTA